MANESEVLLEPTLWLYIESGTGHFPIKDSQRLELREVTMLKRLFVVAVITALSLSAFAVERRHGIVVGEVIKLDSATKTAVVKLADGSEHTFHFVERTTVHGAHEAAGGAEDAFHGLKEGSQVAVHYTAVGSKETAEEVDNIGKDGLKATDAAIVHLDRGTKTLAVRTADGTEETYHLTDSAARDAGKDIAKGSEKSGKVTIYYTEEAGHKVAHFFKAAI
jgi:hypothetical protein